VEGAVDGKTELKRLRRAAARGERNSGQGAVGVEGARAEEQEEGVEKLPVQGIGSERSECYGFWRGMHGGELGF
jgi:hypothetical protein